MRLVKIVNVGGQILGYIPPFPDPISLDGHPVGFIDIVCARKDPEAPMLVEPVGLRLYIDRSGTEHTAYRIYDGAEATACLPGFQPRPANAPAG